MPRPIVFVVPLLLFVSSARAGMNAGAQAWLSWSASGIQTDLATPGASSNLYIRVQGAVSYKGAEVDLRWNPPGDLESCNAHIATQYRTSTTCTYLNRGIAVPITTADDSSHLHLAWANDSANLSCSSGGNIVVITFSYDGCSDPRGCIYLSDVLLLDGNNAQDTLVVAGSTATILAGSDSCAGAELTYGGETDNSPPTVSLVSDQYIQRGMTLTVIPAASDPDGDALTWHGVNLPVGASVSSAAGTLTWTPSDAQAGETYPGVGIVAEDSLGGLAGTTFTITVEELGGPVPDLGDFTREFGQGVNGPVYATCYGSDGNLYVGGSFTQAGNVQVRNIARWDGTAWSDVDGGVDGPVYSLLGDWPYTTSEYGPESRVVVGGGFTTVGTGSLPAVGVAIYDPATHHWTNLGSGLSGGSVRALVWIDDSSSYPVPLYAGGQFTTSGTLSVSGIATWDPVAGRWDQVGNSAGVRTSTNYTGSVWALAVTGSPSTNSHTLLVGGSFERAGGILSNNIAEFVASSRYGTTGDWQALGTSPNVGTDGPVYAIATATAGPLCIPGAAGGFIIGGEFQHVGGASVLSQYFAEWIYNANGQALGWVSHASELDGIVYWLGATLNGSTVYVGGSFGTAGTLSSQRAAAYHPATCSWSQMAGGVGSLSTDYVRCGALGAQAVALGGMFTTAGSQLVNHNVVLWSTTALAWQKVGPNYGIGAEGGEIGVRALCLFDGDLIAAGQFTKAGGLIVGNIARWGITHSPGNWASLGGVSGTVYALTVYRGALIAAGSFATAGGITTTNIATWDGSTWQAMGSGLDGPVYALTVFQDRLIVGGAFHQAGGVGVSNIAQWNGSSWAGLGDGLNSSVNTLSVDRGARVLAGGFFTWSVDTELNYVGSWDGVRWSSLGGGTDGPVSALATFYGKVFAAGGFYMAGNVVANGVARWDGAAWSALGSGVSGQAWSLAAYNWSLLVGGAFTYAGDVSVNNLARWDEESGTWSRLSSPPTPLYGYGVGRGNTTASVRAMTVSAPTESQGPVGSLYVGGELWSAGSYNATNIARWVDPTSPTGITSDNPGGRPRLVLSPSPFSRSVTIALRAVGDSCSAIRVYGVDGRCVRKIQPVCIGSGMFIATWDGRTAAGPHAASGVYLLETRTARGRIVGKVIYAR